MTLSVIIPTFNEADTIRQVIQDVFAYAQSQPPEVVVVDAGSTDGTPALARQAGATVLTATTPGRAAQMNHGARHTTGQVLYFVHADVRLHPDFLPDIQHATEAGAQAGRYRFRFNSDRAMLRINSYSTRFGGALSRGGDQTLFITRTLFERLGGFNERFVIMEDFDLIRRIEQHTPLTVIPKEVVVSARKYEQNSWLRVQLANLAAVALFSCQVSPARIARAYRAMLH